MLYANDSNVKKIVSTALLMGSSLIESGAEISRAEDTINRIIATCYKEKQPINYSIQISIHSIFIKIGDVPADFISIKNRKFNMSRIIRLNQLSRDYISQNISIDILNKKMEQINSEPEKQKSLRLAYGFLSTGISFIFSGVILNIPISFLLGIISFNIYTKIFERIKNSFFNEMVTSFIGGILVTIICYIPYLSKDVLFISFIVAMIPGIKLALGLLDIVNGYPISGFVTVLEGIISIFALSLGLSALSFIFENSKPIITDVSSVPMLTQILGSFICAISFAYIIYIPKKYFIYLGISGILTWIIFVALTKTIHNLLLINIITLSLLNFSSSYLAKLLKTPLIVFIVPSLIIIVPGFTFLQGVNEIMLGYSHMGSYSIVNALISFIGIFIGTLIGNNIPYFFTHLE